MSTQKQSKIKNILLSHQAGMVITASWMEGLGISHALQKRYRKSGWIEHVGQGAYRRVGDQVGWAGAVRTLQQHLSKPVHIGGPTALALQGRAHYLRVKETLWLFSPLKIALPRWFTDYDWGIQVNQIRTGAFPEGKDLVSCMQGTQEVQVSGLARAVMECLFLAPDRVDLSECFHLMEGLTGLQPQLVQELLEACTSVKVKRLFIFLAQRAGHAWLHHIDKSRIDLGTGVRSFHRGGTYIPELGIIVPEEVPG